MCPHKQSKLSNGDGFRIWGSVECAKFAVQDTACWLEHLGLDEKTWEDPEGIRVRVVEGMNSMDYLMPGYFVWGKVRLRSD